MKQLLAMLIGVATALVPSALSEDASAQKQDTFWQDCGCICASSSTPSPQNARARLAIVSQRWLMAEGVVLEKSSR